MKRGITRWIVHGRQARVVSGDELAAMASLGERAGQLDTGKSRTIRILQDSELDPGRRG